MTNLPSTSNNNRLESLVAATALADRSWMYNPQMLEQWPADTLASRLTMISVPVARMFGTTRFYVVTDPTAKPGTQTLIVAVDESATTVRIETLGDFQRILPTIDARSITHEDVLALMQTYVRLMGTRYPQYWDRLKFLSSVNEIPLRKEELMPVELQERIQAPDVQALDQSLRAECYTWTELGGDVKHFVFQLFTDGTIDVQESLLTTGIGQIWLPK